MVLEVGDECVVVIDLGLFCLSFLPGAGKEDGLGSLISIGGGGFMSTGGRSLNVTALYFSPG